MGSILSVVTMKALILMLFISLTLIGCSSTPDAKTSRHSATGTCEAPHNQCMVKCRKVPDGAQSQACMAHCMKRLKHCHDNGSY